VLLIKIGDLETRLINERCPLTGAAIQGVGLVLILPLTLCFEFAFDVVLAVAFDVAVIPE
jgi:hypothetical protein